ncbi:MAG: AAA family ATPase [Christensenellales bacterium]
MKRFTLELEYEWCLKHKDDEKLPIVVVREYLEKILKEEIKVIEADTTSITFDVDDAIIGKNILITVHAILREKYKDDDDCKLDLTLVKTDEPEQDSDTSITEEENRIIESGVERIMVRLFGNGDNTTNSVDCIQTDLDDMVGGEDFKKLIDEIVKIAPQIRGGKNNMPFLYQSYLFAINDGYGLSTYLRILAKVIKSTDIVEINSKKPVLEIAMPNPSNKIKVAELIKDLNNAVASGEDKIKILCIDIREWLDNLNDATFKSLLRCLEKLIGKYIVIFRVPFVDSEVLKKIKDAINDIMFVRSVAFVPFNDDEIKACANKIFEEQNFVLTPDAWKMFQQRIVEEKSDGKFYGVNTIKKVAMELIYKKRLHNANSKKPNSVIGKNQAKGICHHLDDEGMSGYEMLGKLVGGEEVKRKFEEIIAQIELLRKENTLSAPCIHMRFVGNPGTGKTTFARILGKILKEKGVLKIGNFYEYQGRDFCGRYIGETAPKTASMCRDAYGSVLFIDEAYSLFRGDDNDRDFGREALDTLIAEMENHRSEMVLIMAGYTDDMEKLMKGNAGLASRMPYVIEFPNFSREQLYDIFCDMLRGKFSYSEDLLDCAKEYFLAIPDKMLSTKEFSNARFVRNLFERTWAKAAMRSQLAKCKKVCLKKEDFLSACNDKEFRYDVSDKKIGF